MNRNCLIICLFCSILAASPGFADEDDLLLSDFELEHPMLTNQCIRALSELSSPFEYGGGLLVDKDRMKLQSAVVLALRASAPMGDPSIEARIEKLNQQFRGHISRRAGYPTTTVPDIGPEPVLPPRATGWFAKAKNDEAKRQHTEAMASYRYQQDKQRKALEKREEEEEVYARGAAIVLPTTLPDPVYFSEIRDSSQFREQLAKIDPDHFDLPVPKEVLDRLTLVRRRLEIREKSNDPIAIAWQRTVRDVLRDGNIAFDDGKRYPKDTQRPVWQHKIFEWLGLRDSVGNNRIAIGTVLPTTIDAERSKKFSDKDIQEFLRIILDREDTHDNFFSPLTFPNDWLSDTEKAQVANHAISKIDAVDYTREEINAAFYIASWGMFSKVLYAEGSVKDQINRHLLLRHFDQHGTETPPVIDPSQLDSARFVELAHEPRVQELSREFMKPLEAFARRTNAQTQSKASIGKLPTEPNPTEPPKTSSPAERVYSNDEIESLRAKASKLHGTSAHLAIHVDEPTQQAAQRLSQLERDLRKRFVERDDLISVLVRALIGDKNVLMVGPGGTAKTSVSKSLMRSFVDEGGTSSLFWHQMTESTTLNDVMGPLDPGSLQQGHYRRLLGSGMLVKRLAFLDEFFNPPPRVIQNLLGIMGDREAYVDGETLRGATDSVFAATNKYTSQIYSKLQNDDLTPNRDRFTYHQYVGGEIERFSSTLAMEQNGGAPFEPSRKIPFSELDALKRLARSLPIPLEVTAARTYLFEEMKRRTDEEALAAARAIEEQQPHLAPWGPRYYPTRLYTGRSMTAAPEVLRDGVVERWLHNPTAAIAPIRIEDLSLLEPFFVTSGRATPLIEAERQTALNRDHIAQLDTVLIERRAFEEAMRNLRTGIAHSTTLGRVRQIAQELTGNPDRNTLAGHLDYLLNVTEKAEAATTLRNKEITPEVVATIQAAREARELIPRLTSKLEGN